jgi:hypothetical protein
LRWLILAAWAQSQSWNFFVSLLPTNNASAGQPIDSQGPETVSLGGWAAL